MTKRRASRADPFDVWGNPPRVIAKIYYDDLRKYVEAVTSKAYKLGYECGKRARADGEHVTEKKP